MADIELVIKIPEELYKSYKGRPPMLGDEGMDMIAQSIANGTPLPKGHGNIYDERDLVGKVYFQSNVKYRFPKLIINATPIIEADKEYEAKVITRGNCMMCGKELTEGLFFCKECENKANSRK